MKYFEDLRLKGLISHTSGVSGAGAAGVRLHTMVRFRLCKHLSDYRFGEQEYLCPQGHKLPYGHQYDTYSGSMNFSNMTLFPSIVMNSFIQDNTPRINCLSLVIPRPYMTMEYSDAVFVRMIYWVRCAVNKCAIQSIKGFLFLSDGLDGALYGAVT
jgi:hypothetical protein